MVSSPNATRGASLVAHLDFHIRSPAETAFLVSLERVYRIRRRALAVAVALVRANAHALAQSARARLFSCALRVRRRARR